MTTTRTPGRDERVATRREKNAHDLAGALVASHAEAHRLIEKLTVMVDSVDPETADWGDVADLGYVIDKLREATREADTSPATAWSSALGWYVTIPTDDDSDEV